MTSKSAEPKFVASIRWPFWLGALFLITLAIVWTQQTPSREEAFGDTVKISDIHRALSAGWTPNYMLGHSPVMLNAVFWGVSAGYWAIALLGGFLGALAATKLMAVAYMALAAWAMFSMLRRMGCDRVASQLGGLLYLVLPSMNVRLGTYEHFGVGPCFIFLPMILRGILAVAEERSPREIVLLGLSASGLALAYTKIAIVASPIFLIWALEAVRRNRPHMREIFTAYAWSLLIAGVSGLSLLIPALREFGFAAGFLFDPLDGWQHHYSFKTPLLWIDLWGALTKGGDGNLTGDAAMFWIGLIPLAALSLALSLSSLAEWRSGQAGRWFLLLTASWLIATWFAAGPDGFLLGHINVLKTGQGLPDTSIPILWLAFIWMGWLIYRTASDLLFKVPFWLPGLVTAVVLVLPVFRITNVLPLFNDVRAPESYWSLAGYSCLTGAVTMALWVLFTQVISKSWRRPAAITTGILMLVELYPVHSAFWTRGMERELFSDYDQAAAFLKTAPIPGRVHPLSGRYFYLTLPEKAGRAIDTESAWRHFQLKWVRHLEAAGNASGESLQAFLNLAGDAYILIDKEDPFSPKQMQDFFRSVYPVVFENRYFAVLANQNALYPAFLAHDFVVLPQDSSAMAPAALQILPKNLIMVEADHLINDLPGFAGQANGTNQIALLPQYQSQNGQPFARVPLVGNRMDDYGRMTYQLPPSASGWLVVSEAYHPDWTVSIDGKPAQASRAEVALLATYVPQGSHEVSFVFRPPVWYNLLTWISALIWCVLLMAIALLPSRIAPPFLREWWRGK
jgi:hypothetical protein